MATAAPSSNDQGAGLQQRPGDSAQPHCDIAMTALADVKAAIDRGDIEGRCDAVTRATEAVTALFLDVDARGGGRMVENAGRLYRALLAGLIRINLGNDAAAVGAVSALLEPLRGTWTLPKGARANAQNIHHVR